MDFAQQHERFRARVEDALDRLVPPADTRPDRLHKAMRHSIFAGGKRLRPVLVLVGHALYPSKLDPLPAAVAVECLHTYTLIHDDLPCMDNSDLRRGVATCHKAFDEVTALLAGDALLTFAFELLASSYVNHPERAGPLVLELAKGSGSRGVIGGQMEDILSERGGRPASNAQLDYIHQHKTAELLATSLAMGAIVGNSNPDTVSIVRAIGLKLGLTFQIVDDILDATSSTVALGKTAGRDAALEKLTHVRLHGLDASRRRARQLTSETLELCDRLDGANTDFLRHLIAELEHRVK